METQQLELGAYARRTDPATSHAAAESVRGRMVTALEAEVVAALRAFPDGMTTHELSLELDEEYGSITPRIRPLVRKGMVVDSGVRRIPAGRTKAGIVWRAV